MEVNGIKIKELLVNKKMSQRDLAKCVGIDHRHLNKIIGGTSATHEATAKRIADCLGVTLYDITSTIDRYTMQADKIAILESLVEEYKTTILEKSEHINLLREKIETLLKTKK